MDESTELSSSEDTDYIVYSKQLLKSQYEILFPNSQPNYKILPSSCNAFESKEQLDSHLSSDEIDKNDMPLLTQATDIVNDYFKTYSPDLQVTQIKRFNHIYIIGTNCKYCKI